jgi:hypothetical protein
MLITIETIVFVIETIVFRTKTSSEAKAIFFVSETVFSMTGKIFGEMPAAVRIGKWISSIADITSTGSPERHRQLLLSKSAGRKMLQQWTGTELYRDCSLLSI